jgi:hypothetical protein
MVDRCEKCGHLWGAYEDACHCTGPCHNRDGCTAKFVLAIVGSSELPASLVERAAAVIETVLDLFKPTKVISGAAPGIDKMAIAAAKRRGLDWEEFPPKEQNWERGFKPRNMLIAQKCDRLVRIIKPNQKTYGSGWTRDYAALLGKLTQEFVI